MPKVQVKLDKAAVRQQLLKNGTVAGMCMSIAQQMANKAGTGYAVRATNYPERAGAVVYPKTAKARRENYRRNTLEKARGGKFDD